MALGALQEDWARHASREKERHEKAVQALLLIEKRNLLAGKISRSLRARADVQRAPFEVVEMLLGPWSQVLAQAHLNSPADTGDPGALGALVSDLLWSVNVELAGADENRLIKQIPGLLRKLRQGLESIDFPAARINEFLRFLTGLHQQILQPAAQPRGAADFSMSSAALKSHFDQADMAGVWLVGEEARDSGFLDALPVMDAGVPMLPTSARADRDFRFAVQPGAWVELLIQKKWVRAQLTWASPQGTLYMFTSVSGGTHSMTCRSFERLCKEGTARLIASQALLDGALDAVAQTALRNSLDIRP
jgi:hypothetical protein